MRIMSLIAFLMLFTTGAQASGYYVGITRGQSEFESDVSVSKPSSIDNKSSAGYIFFGREFDNNAAVEGFYANLGKINMFAKKGSTVSSGSDKIMFSEDASLSSSATSFGIAGKYYFNVHEGVRISAKLGMHSWKSKLNVSDNVEKRRFENDGVNAMAGLGVEYAVTDKIGLMAGIDNFAIDEENTTITHVGLKFSFD